MQVILAITTNVDAKDQARYVAAGMNDSVNPDEFSATMQKWLHGQDVKSG